MPDPWLTFAPLQPDGILPAEINLPYYFNEQVSLRLIPEWVRQADTVDELRPELREKIRDDGSRHCIGVEYQADGPGSPDPNWKGDPPWSLQDTAVQLVRSAHLALWLARPTALSFNIVIDAEQDGPGWVTRSITTYTYTHPLAEYQQDEHTLEDLATARTLFNALLGVSFEGPVRTAAMVTMKALHDQLWEFRFLLMWLVMECLFGPEDARETTFRISQRVALFLERDRVKARDLFRQVIQSYGWRSKIVHGLKLSKLKEEKTAPLLVELEALVRRSLLAILEKEALAKTFDGKEREKFLDGLAFTQSQTDLC